MVSYASHFHGISDGQNFVKGHLLSKCENSHIGCCFVLECDTNIGFGRWSFLVGSSAKIWCWLCRALQHRQSGRVQALLCALYTLTFRRLLGISQAIILCFVFLQSLVSICSSNGDVTNVVDAGCDRSICKHWYCLIDICTESIREGKFASPLYWGYSGLLMA